MSKLLVRWTKKNAREKSSNCWAFTFRNNNLRFIIEDRHVVFVASESSLVEASLPPGSGIIFARSTLTVHRTHSMPPTLLADPWWESGREKSAIRSLRKTRLWKRRPLKVLFYIDQLSRFYWIRDAVNMKYVLYINSSLGKWRIWLLV